MSEMYVRIVRLEPMRVISALGFGPSPEDQAWKMLMAWAKQHEQLDDIGTHRFFGFNNPNPSPGSPNYGYEQWMTVDDTQQPEGELRIIEFMGGLYAVARCKGVEQIYQTWQQLAAWPEDSHYKYGSHLCLEECLTPQMFVSGETPSVYEEAQFDLYLPIVE